MVSQPKTPLKPSNQISLSSLWDQQPRLVYAVFIKQGNMYTKSSGWKKIGALNLVGNNDKSNKL